MVKPRIAIVGLGLIGGSLARRLVNAGCEVTAWNHNDRPYATAEADGIICKPTLAALAETNRTCSYCATRSRPCPKSSAH